MLRLKQALRDHPHACGDKIFIGQFHVQPEGSSPRVWGQAPANVDCNTVFRIIPTRVGTSSLRITAMCLMKDHPHACGDKHKVYTLSVP